MKTLLTALAVLLVSAVARRGGRRLAGVIAALPMITAPTLGWLAHEQGPAYAASAAVGSVAACAVLAAFALGYGLAARQRGIALALLGGLAGALAAMLPVVAASARLVDALALALACSALALAALPATGLPDAAPLAAPRPLALALAAAGVTALIATLGPALGSFATGMLSSLPLVGASVVLREHAGAGPEAAAQFLRGYVWGLFGKAAFGAAFALLAPRLGAAAALALACGCAAALSALKPPCRLVAPPVRPLHQPD
ncbi:hypothetical protein [Derxia lacustris]|uniref:hypothetical protein n=1 Tax=Derxia lacustris TaxID=764842 RepID=UPI00111BEBE7|nr:hypothetical protein [Derxia lacustris]